MMLAKFFSKNSKNVNPESTSELETMARKWQITIHELCRAIVETGTTNSKKLKLHIKKTKAKQKYINGLRSHYDGMYIVRT
jgi:hypothetical protein